MSDLVGIWPSILFSILALALWTDYAYGAWRAYVTNPARGVLREYIVAVAVIACCVGLALGVIFAWLPPGEVDPPVVVMLSAVRSILLSVGIWLAWDRRIYRPPRT